MKDYETSAEMFEKSMLYLPLDIVSKVLRAKSFRVLCLCYLGLSQLDRAQEYIIEAEKVFLITLSLSLVPDTIEILNHLIKVVCNA